MIAASALFATACQQKVDGPDEKPQPSISTISQISDISDVAYKGDSTVAISFKSDSSWSASSDKTWCELSVKSGSSGDASVTLRIQANPLFEARQALLTFIEGAGPRAINKTVKVTQLPLERKITVTDVDGNPITKAILVLNEESGVAEYKTRVIVTANFPWYLSAVPVWMPELQIKGDANEAVRMWLSVDPKKLETSTQVGTVQYHDQASMFIFNLDVEFAGVGNEYLKHDLPGALSFAKNNSTGGMTQRFFNVVTANAYTSLETAPFKIISTEVVPDPTGGDNHTWKPNAFEVNWLDIYYNKSMTRSVVNTVPWYVGASDNGGDTRAAVILIVPKSVLPTDLNDMLEEVDGVWGLKATFQKYHATTIIQESDVLKFSGTENYDITIPAAGGSNLLIVKAFTSQYPDGVSLEWDQDLADAGWFVEPQYVSPGITAFRFNEVPANETGAEKRTVHKVVYEDWDNVDENYQPTRIPLGTITVVQPAN